MSNETKRDVFDELLKMFRNSMKLTHEEPVILDNDGYDIFGKIEKSYADALPDDLPVIPEAVSEWIKECKHRNVTLADTLCMEMRPENVRNWMAFKDGNVAKGFDSAGYHRKQETMASAWLLGVWIVEETGEIVKLEAEK